MKATQNKGFDPVEIKNFKSQLKAADKTFLLVDSDENNDEYKHFSFLGKFEGQDVVYDTVIYTLRLQHQSELFELAEHKAAIHFPTYKKIVYNEDENGDLQPLDPLEEEIGLFIADAIMEMEEEGDVKVSEHIELDTRVEYGIGMDVGLNLERITDRVIEKFIKEFNDDSIVLDESLVSFETRGEEAN